ncbi:MAG: uroporphyrinogen-III synthase [Methyloceanibacter sp.]
MRILVTRPEPDASQQAERLAALGHEPVLAPLLEIEFLPDVKVNLEGVQGLIATSRNALRALAPHPARAEAQMLPLLAVGEATAAAATELGFTDVTIGPGTGEALAALIRVDASPDDGELLHLAGDAVAFDLKSALRELGFTVRQTVLYKAVPANGFQEEARAMLEGGRLDGVILMSPRTARIFAALLGQQGVVSKGSGLVCYCLSQAVAEAVIPLGFETRIAVHPSEEEVLALLDSEAPSWVSRSESADETQGET